MSKNLILNYLLIAGLSLSACRKSNYGKLTSDSDSNSNSLKAPISPSATIAPVENHEGNCDVMPNEIHFIIKSTNALSRKMRVEASMGQESKVIYDDCSTLSNKPYFVTKSANDLVFTINEEDLIRPSSLKISIFGSETCEQTAPVFEKYQKAMRITQGNCWVASQYEIQL